MGTKDKDSGGNRCNALSSKNKGRQDSPALLSL